MGPPDFVIFFGRFHPLVVHLPIGFLLLAILMEFAGRKEKYKHLSSALPFVWMLSAASAVVAAILGYLLSLAGGYNEDTLFWHQWSGILLALLSVGIWLVKSGRLSLKSKQLQTGGIIASAILLMVAGHMGGSLTHGSDYLTQYMPGREKSESERPPVTNLASAEAFGDVVQPIINARCKSCHNPDKKKGELLMTSYATLMEGGESGAIIQTGNADESELYKRIILPEDHDDHMPPEGKKPLTEEQIAILHWWINEGAPEKTVLSAMNVPDEMNKTISEYLGLSASSPMAAMAASVSPLDESSIENLRLQGFNASRIAQDNPFIEVDFSVSDTILGNDQLQALEAVKDHVLWLNLGRSSTSDEALATVGKCKNLVRLRLQQTEISDAGLAQLKDLQNLESLNLFGTQITDKGLSELTSLKNLKRLYVWGTQVTPDGVKALQEALPELEINTGVQQSLTTN